ncbi:unnamed protein product [Parnassius mnemosyne]|uniref:Reverse transcriptase domain-containing protein n=4 Tax=Parnassius mnemosyne TaxID=213953 RepID=A0AAV1LVU4_9NEOP
MADCIRSVARKVLGETKGKRMIDKDGWWWSESIREVLREKKNAFKEWQSVEDQNESIKESKRGAYKECKKRAKKEVAICRAEAHDKLYRSLESPEGQKRLFQIARARERNGRDVSHVKCIKDDSGRILTDDESIKKRWKEYFEKLMNEENEWNGMLENPPVNMGLVREISVEEVKMAVRNMKNGKAVGPDGIPVEVWKLLRADGWKWLSLFFGKLLQEEQIPEEWCSSILVPIFKNKGDVQNCSSYRGIKLMSHTMKVWERIIERRMREECEITQNQFGFMPGRGTTDAIFALRQLCEKYKRVHKDLHMVFVDLEKAYDRVPREVLWWALKMKGMPGKYVRLVRAMYRASRTCVRSAAGTTGSIDVAVGLHQGSALSPYLFLLIMDALTSDLQDEAPWCMLFADDIVLVGEEGIEVQSRLTGWQRRLESVGLKISRSKTEYLCCDFGGLSSPVPMSLDGAILPICSDVKYLGSFIQGDGGIDRAIQDDTADLHGVSQPVVSRTCKKVAEILSRKSREFIKMPTTLNEQQETIRKFRSIANFPTVIGAIDCTHIRVKKVNADGGQLYINRKGFSSINVQVVCDADLKIMDIVTRWRGSVHDSRIFRECRLKQRFEAGAFSGILLGDSGYPCTPYLFTPLLNPTTPQEERYNRSHIRTRNTVERCFGLWKQRFRCLLRGMFGDIETAKKTIVACAVLHNMAIDMREDVFSGERDSIEQYSSEPIVQRYIAPSIRGNIRRRQFIETHFQ